MMKLLCVAVVVLSLISVGQPAPLVCEKLLKPVDKAPDFPGIWYLVAMTSDTCVVTTLLNYVLWPSVSLNITSMNTPNVYKGNYRFKMYGYCETDSEEFFSKKNMVFDVDVNNAPVDEPDMLLQSGCSDCFIVKRVDKDIDMLMLFSRRQNVSAAELNEFEKQAECLGWAKPEVINSDHDIENCLSLDDDDTDNLELIPMIFQRLRNNYAVPFKCVSESVQTFHKAVYEWAQQQWATLW
ncbi:saxitoxin and tetrodotoxin-binding protein 1-like isoform X1 [Etheostoma cragini]|uniref:saxitoxin and tetrodotoxin-binding protein 1-like isoform X1 n=1 Tax=Etheostoma cragini TaxID=417921 RepID=UPI00155E9F8E|nr:saxitoxin and tetrodotoxin-binding protein 1-like isoform X1 [Etheostoma cragini]